MSTPNIIAVSILVGAFLAMVGIRIYMASKKQDKPMTFDDFIDTYGNQIIKVLQDTITILQININEFPDKEQYEKAIINTTIMKLKENAVDFGIDQNIIKLFDTDALTEVVYTVMNKNLVEVFSVLTPTQINDNQALYEQEVTAALTEAN